MSAGPVAESAHSDGRSLAERAAAILRDEIANGALASIGLADKRWSAVRHDLGRATSSSIDQDALIRTVLDLIAPPSCQQPSAPSVFAPRAANEVEPGGSAVISMAVQNDGPTDVELSFTWTDLVAPPDRRIDADRIRLDPPRARIPANHSADLEIVFRAPLEAASGVYRSFVQATDEPDLSAVLTFPVGRPVGAGGVRLDRHGSA
jgi:hypothetical protein